MHHLNRAEYARSVRDFLGLDIDAAALLPPDEESYGFDNVADVMKVSPLLLERYLSASRKISRLAIGDPQIDPVAESSRVRPDLSQHDHIEGLPLGTRGGLLISHNFPLDGEYVLSVKLARNDENVIRGLEESHQLELTVDGAQALLETLGGKSDLTGGGSESDEGGNRH